MFKRKSANKKPKHVLPAQKFNLSYSQGPRGIYRNYGYNMQPFYDKTFYLNHKANLFKKSKKIFPERSDFENDKTYLSFLIDGCIRLCNFGSLHGFKYVTDRKKPYWERFVWTIACGMSIAVCAMYIFSISQRWLSVPFSLVIDEQYTPIYDIPFPTVIVCPENTVKKSYIDLSKTNNSTILFAASLICDRMSPENFSLHEGVGPEVDETIMDFLTNSFPTCSETFKSCTWRSSNNQLHKTTDCCSEYFHPFITNNGMCFGFNMAAHLKSTQLNEIAKNKSIYIWSPENGYQFEKEGTMPYPRRVFSVGENFGLRIELRIDTSDVQYECDGPEGGFKILISSPIENVFLKNYANIPMDKHTSFSIIANKITTDTSMMSIDPKIRKCYFQDEMSLTYFDFYTLDNCIQDCELKYIIDYCNCVPFYFKTLVPHVPICKTYKMYVCTHNVKAKVNLMGIARYYSKKPGSNFDEKTVLEEYDDGIRWCPCYPNCVSLHYNMEISYSDTFSSKHRDENSTPHMDETSFDVGFKEALFLGSHRTIEFGTMDFISSAGGILSLFLGFSIMSMIEIVYYLLFHPTVTWILIRIKRCFTRNEPNTVFPYVD